MLRLALAAVLAATLLAVVPGSASAAACGRHPVGSGPDNSAARISTSRVSCKRGIRMIDRWYTKASPRCSGGECPVLRVDGFRCVTSKQGAVVRCKRGRRVVKGSFGL